MAFRLKRDKKPKKTTPPKRQSFYEQKLRERQARFEDTRNIMELPARMQAYYKDLIK